MIPSIVRNMDHVEIVNTMAMKQETIGRYYDFSSYFEIGRI
jgi:hypothetical protein